jgi:AbrB family looped-hinge helix DNA binding protein
MEFTTYTAQIVQGGRLILPAKARQNLGLTEGSRVTLNVYRDHIAIIPLDQSLAAHLAKAAKLLKGPSLADELMAERSREAEHE